MSIPNSTRIAYSEIDNFLELLDIENREKIPKKLRDIFKREKDINYIKNIDRNISIDKQNLKEETLALIALLNLKYWCNDENEKERLKKIYENNEVKYNNEINKNQIGFNFDEVLQVEDNEVETKLEKELIPNTKRPLHIKLINKIKKIFVR